MQIRREVTGPHAFRSLVSTTDSSTQTTDTAPLIIVVLLLNCLTVSSSGVLRALQQDHTTASSTPSHTQLKVQYSQLRLSSVIRLRCWLKYAAAKLRVGYNQRNQGTQENAYKQHQYKNYITVMPLARILYSKILTVYPTSSPDQAILQKAW